LTKLAKAVTESEALRKVAIPAYRMYARALVFNRGPRVLANSMPKAGTHLAAALLQNLPQMKFSGRHHTFAEFELSTARPADERQGLWESEIDWGRLERSLSAVNKGQYMTAHFGPLPRLVSVLEQLEYRTIVMLRDPRDVAVSTVFYVSRLKRHRLYERFNSEITSFDDRLMASIVGVAAGSRRGLVPINRRISRYKRWLDVPNVFPCRFEDLIGPSGGGSVERQRAAIIGISNHVARPVGPDEADGLAARTWSTNSSTFRKGTIGDWRNHFTEEHKDAFKALAGDLLIDLGYESDLDW
jgi:hypothetical protein